MKIIPPAPNNYFIVFIFIFGYYIDVTSCLNMWTSLDEHQANKTPVKRCISPCKFFHSWCKNDGKCREKGKDCTWYCECPENCEGFFCEKIVTKESAVPDNTAQVSITYEKETKKDITAFDKSKLAQALAGIFKKNQNEEEKKITEPETVDRVGNTIETKENVTAKIILNCPPEVLANLAPDSANKSDCNCKTTVDSVLPANDAQTSYPDNTTETNTTFTKNTEATDNTTTTGVNSFATNETELYQTSSTVAVNETELNQNSSTVAANEMELNQNSSTIAANETELYQNSSAIISRSTPIVKSSLLGGTSTAAVVETTDKSNILDTQLKNTSATQESSSALPADDAKSLEAQPQSEKRENSLFKTKEGKLKTEGLPKLLQVIEKAIKIDIFSTTVPTTRTQDGKAISTVTERTEGSTNTTSQKEIVQSETTQNPKVITHFITTMSTIRESTGANITASATGKLYSEVNLTINTSEKQTSSAVSSQFQNQTQQKESEMWANKPTKTEKATLESKTTPLFQEQVITNTTKTYSHEAVVSAKTKSTTEKSTNQDTYPTEIQQITTLLDKNAVTVIGAINTLPSTSQPPIKVTGLTVVSHEVSSSINLNTSQEKTTVSTVSPSNGLADPPILESFRENMSSTFDSGQENVAQASSDVPVKVEHHKSDVSEKKGLTDLKTTKLLQDKQEKEVTTAKYTAPNVTTESLLFDVTSQKINISSVENRENLTMPESEASLNTSQKLLSEIVTRQTHTFLTTTGSPETKDHANQSINFNANEKQNGTNEVSENSKTDTMPFNKSDIPRVTTSTATPPISETTTKYDSSMAIVTETSSTKIFNETLSVSNSTVEADFSSTSSPPPTEVSPVPVVSGDKKLGPEEIESNTEKQPELKSLYSNTNEFLNNKLPDSVKKKDLKIDLLKLELREKGLTSDIDNIL